jgi:hypothetical protein
MADIEGDLTGLTQPGTISPKLAATLKERGIEPGLHRSSRAYRRGLRDRVPPQQTLGLTPRIRDTQSIASSVYYISTHIGRRIMFLTARRFAVSLGLAGLLASPAALAGLGDPALAPGGEVVATFEGASASFDSMVIMVNGVPIPLFLNHSTLFGTTAYVSTFAAGTVLDFALLVTTTGNVFHSGPAAGNPDGLAHAVVTYNYLTPGNTLVAFEDILGGGDKDYNDYVFSFKSVTAIPEPESSMLMLAGLMAVAWLARRRKSTRF